MDLLEAIRLSNYSEILSNSEDIILANIELNELWTPVMISCSAGHYDVVHILLKNADIDIDCINSSGRTALHYLASKGHINIFHLLVQKGAQFDFKDKFGITPLHLAVTKGHSQIVKELIQRVDSVDCKDSQGKTPLHYACEEGKKDSIEILIKSGANNNILDKDKKKPSDLIKDDNLKIFITNLLMNKSDS